MSLKEYARKRDFRKTAEPKGGRVPRRDAHRFVVQKHDASRLHYDFRLELDGTLKSWAVPKGVPYKKGERRLAVQVEDHPVEYIDFEGTIPEGQYGGGTVMVWDTGGFTPLSDDPVRELAGGKLHFVLNGKKLRGEWYLVQLRGGKDWLLIKGGQDMKPVGPRIDDSSAASGRSMAAIAKAGDRVWSSDRSDDGVAPLKKPRTGAKRARRQQDQDVESPARQRGAATPAKRRRVRRGSATKAFEDPRDQGVASPSTASDPAAEAPPARGAVGFQEPMKALLVDTAPKGEWLYEIKFDGFRALGLRDGVETRLLSRNNRDLAGKFPEVRQAVAALRVRDAILDGEVVALDAQGRSSFQLLQAYDLGQERPPICYFAFDLLRLNGRDLRPLPLRRRRAELQRLLGGAAGVIRFSDALGSDAAPLLEQARKLGLEGLIGKRPDSAYETGARSGAWIKLKLHQEQEFVIGGYTPPAGTRLHFGAVLVGVYDGDVLKFAGKVGTGFDEARLRSLRARFHKIATDRCPFSDLPEKRAGRYGQGVTAAEMRRCHWVRPELVCQVRFSEWTRDAHLRQPVFLGLREDKPAREVVREHT